MQGRACYHWRAPLSLNSLTGASVVCSWPASFLTVLFLFTAGLDIGPGCVGSLRESPSPPCWDFYTEQPGGSHSRGPEALEIVSAGLTEGHLLILCGMNMYTYKRYLDPKQVYKESLFSDRCLISLVVLLISLCNTHALKFLVNEFPPGLVSW